MGKYEDRTDPYRVKALRHRVEEHDHRNGICDLKADPNHVRQYSQGECGLVANDHDPEMRCNCSMCAGDSKERRRELRRKNKGEARNWWRWL